MPNRTTNPVRTAQGAAPAGTSTENVESQHSEQQNAPEKIIGQAVLDAIKNASKSLKGDTLGATLEEAADKVATDSKWDFRDPSLSQYVVGLVLYFDPEHSVVKEVSVGNVGNSTVCITVPAGLMRTDGTYILTKAFNVYVSTLRKEIRVHDENGEPVLGPDKSPIVVNGGNNTIWNEMRGYNSVSAVLTALSGRTLHCTKILRDFGPSNYVGNEGERRPTGHRLTSIPLFEEI